MAARTAVVEELLNVVLAVLCCDVSYADSSCSHVEPQVYIQMQLVVPTVR